MKCGFSEERIALYVENDLAQAERLEVEAHVLDCAECRQFVEELRESQTIFKSLRAETVSPAALANVRERVLLGLESNWMLRIERFLFAGLRWRYALAGVVLVAVVSGSVWFWNEPETPIPVGELYERPAGHRPALQPAVKPAAPLIEKTVRPVRRLKPKPAAEPKQVVVKLLTDDPNIVIYWLVDEKNGGER